MNDIKIDRNQLWTTTIFTVRNPLHGQIVEALKSHIYAHMQASGAGIHSGISTDIKTNLLEAATRICVPPEDGMLVIFPSYLFHSGTLYRGQQRPHSGLVQRPHIAVRRRPAITPRRTMCMRVRAASGTSLPISMTYRTSA